jgi:peptide/nickel transport system ATP-binding protein
MPQLASTPKTELTVIRGVVPALDQMPSGCRFRDRCDYAVAACASHVPEVEDVGPTHKVACIRWRELPS